MKSALLLVACCILAGCGGPAAEVRKPEATAPPEAAIIQFYASPTAIAPGDHALLCYGVENAASVRLEPPVEDITPSRTRCVEVKPAASTKYTLFAKSKLGVEISRQTEVTIDPKLPRASAPSAGQGGGGLILFFTALAPKVPKGMPATLCYGVKGAASVSLNPAVQQLEPRDKLCFQVRPEATTTYTLTATSASGVKDTETLRITVE